MGVGALSGAAIGGATSVMSQGLTNILSGQKITDGLFVNILPDMVTGAILGGIQGGIEGYQFAKENGINPWTREYIDSHQSYSSSVESFIGQTDPTKHCYAYATKNALRNDIISINDILNLTDYEDGYAIHNLLPKLKKSFGIKYSEFKAIPTKTFSFNMREFGKYMNSNKASCVLSLKSSDSMHAVNLHSYESVVKSSAFRLNSHTVLKNISVWDPALKQCVFIKNKSIIMGHWLFSK